MRRVKDYFLPLLIGMFLTAAVLAGALPPEPPCSSLNGCKQKDPGCFACCDTNCLGSNEHFACTANCPGA